MRRQRAVSILALATTVVIASCVTPPAAPTSLVVQFVTPVLIGVTWTDNANNEDAFLVEWRPVSCPTCWSQELLDADSTGHIVSSLTEGTPYIVRVRALRCDSGTHPGCSFGGASSALTSGDVYTKLATPTGFSASDRLGDAGVNLAWTDASSNETEYKVERKGSHEASYTTIATLSPGSTSFQDKPRWEGATWVEGALDWARYQYRVTARKLDGGGGLVTSSSSATGSVETAWGATSLDWCSMAVVRPDQRWDSQSYPSSCVLTYPVAELAENGARLALVGTDNVLTPAFDPYPTGACTGAALPYDGDSDGTKFGATQADLGAYIQDVKDERALEGGPPIEFVHENRFDLLTTQWVAQPGFDSDYLVRTTTPIADVISFYEEDTSADCIDPPDPEDPCALHATAKLWSQYEEYEYWADKSVPAFIDAEGGAGDHETAVFYMARSSPGTTWHWPIAVIADQRDADYRAWRVGEASDSKSVGKWDYVELNNKFHMYRPVAEFWLGDGPSNVFANVTALNASGDTPWSAPPDGYGLAEYAASWNDLSADLDADGVPFSVLVNPFMFRPADTYYDDPSTGYNDRVEIEEGILRADLVVIDRQKTSVITDTEFRDIMEDVRAAIAPHGGRTFVVESSPAYGSACPWQGQ